MSHVQDMDDARRPPMNVEEERIRSIVDGYSLPSLISGYEVRIENTWDGEPGAWILLHTPPGEDFSDTDQPAFIDVLNNLPKQIRLALPDREVFVRFIIEPPRPN